MPPYSASQESEAEQPYEAISNYAGNSFCQKSWEMIEKSNPFHIGNPHAGVAMNSLAGFLAKSKITIMGGNQA